ncbi:hypothetical protein F5051DRAFT_423801, partial [Lentinula edodes]
MRRGGMITPSALLALGMFLDCLEALLSTFSMPPRLPHGAPLFWSGVLLIVSQYYEKGRYHHSFTFACIRDVLAASGSASGPLSNALSGVQVNACTLSYPPVTVPLTLKPFLWYLQLYFHDLFKLCDHFLPSRAQVLEGGVLSCLASPDLSLSFPEPRFITYTCFRYSMHHPY